MKNRVVHKVDVMASPPGFSGAEKQLAINQLIIFERCWEEKIIQVKLKKLQPDLSFSASTTPEVETMRIPELWRWAGLE